MEYKRARLLQLVYDHVISDLGRDNILRYFLTAMTTPLGENPITDFSHVLAILADFGDRNTSEKDEIMERVKELADHLVEGFFLPSKFIAANMLRFIC